ncbi:MAG: M14 family metallopeptidase [Candidatus Bathyarchaeota archaeon]
MTVHVTSPESFFGFKLGSDRNIARWDRIVEYFNLLGRESDRIKVVDVGPCTEGAPFLLVVISSPENLSRLEELRRLNLRLSDPRGLSEEEAEALIAEGKAVVCQSMSLHASEIAPTQMAPELAYELLSGGDEDTLRVLDNVVFLMVPCFNPDGQTMVADWYEKWKGTEYEGCDLPWLYHRYGGHDNNRDAFQTNMVESRYMASILFKEWVPQAYVDHHQMGGFGARFYIPPYTEPMRPYADPLVYWEHMWYGGHMATLLEQEGKEGVIAGGSTFPAWGHLGWHRITNHHNICGMLTETASAKLATPVHVQRDQLKGNHFSFPQYVPQVNFPHPWMGGWWRLREMVEQIKVSAWATLDHAARNRETVLRNAYLKAVRQTERGSEDPHRAYVIPADQHDASAAHMLVEKLLLQGIEIHVAEEGFEVENTRYAAGSYVILSAQPKYGVVKSLLARTFYPDNAWTREKDGTPRAPRDMATDTMPEFMGVKVCPVGCAPQAKLTIIEEANRPRGEVKGSSSHGYALDCRQNISYRAAVALLDAGARVRRATEPVQCGDRSIPAGAFIVTHDRKLLQEVASSLGVTFHAVSAEPKADEVKKPRVGLYQRYRGGNADEGWTRLVLEQFGFAYETLMDEDIDEGLRERLDVVVLPSDPAWILVGDDVEKHYEETGAQPPKVPPEYRSGLHKEGVGALVRFVSEGGTLVCLNESSMFAVDAFQLSLGDAIKGLPSKEFFCPASTLHATVDTGHVLGYGMPEDSLLFFWDSPAFTVKPCVDSERYEVVARYPDHQILESGWLDGEKHLAGKAALVVARVGSGRVVLFGLRPQHRAQTHGTYKLLFNSLLM